jgi:hypothetical protein
MIEAVEVVVQVSQVMLATLQQIPARAAMVWPVAYPGPVYFTPVAVVVQQLYL